MEEILEEFVRDGMEYWGYIPWEESKKVFRDTDGLLAVTMYGYFNGVIAKFGLKEGGKP